MIQNALFVLSHTNSHSNPLRAALVNWHGRPDATISTVQYLLSAGANLNAPPSGDYVSTLAAAVWYGYGNLIDALLAADSDINAHNPELGTALIASARHPASAHTLKLLEHGANPHLTGGRWGSAIHAAAQSGNPEVVEWLLDLGVSSNLVAGRYGYVLQAACNPQDFLYYVDYIDYVGRVDYMGRVDCMGCIRILLARGAEINARGGKYETALQCAAMHGKLPAVRLLIEHGADPTIRGGKYGSASRAAKEEKHWHVYNYLERYIKNITMNREGPRAEP
jgi:ankyrin repeat protein